MKSSSFEVGSGVCVSGYSDSKAGTVVEVSKSGKMVVVQRDSATLLNGANSGEKDALVFHVGGFSAHCVGSQRYAFKKNEKGSKYVFTLRKNGKWVEKGFSMKAGSGGYSLSEGRYEYYDFNF